MKTTLSAVRHRRAVRIGVFVIAAALITGIAGCQAGPSYIVTISSTDGGSVTAPGEGVFSYRFCMDVDLVATPDSGYRFVKWLGDLTSIADVNSAATTISVTRGNYHITAMFEEIPPIQYSLTVASTVGGSVTVPGEGVFTRGEGTVVNLVAIPDAGYEFANWSGDVDTILNAHASSTTITMNSHKSITANFEATPPVQYNLIVSSTAGGSVTEPGEETFTYAANTVVNLVANPDDGYDFVNWSGDVTTITDIYASSTAIIMNSHKSITAHFEAEPPYTPLNVHFTADKLEVEAGETVTFTNKTTGGTPPYLAAEWDFGDGITSTQAAQTGETVTHVYIAPGVYSVSLTIVDIDEALRETALDYITVHPAA